MEKSLARPADEIERVVKTYGNMLFRLCLVMLGSESDAAFSCFTGNCVR